jgi:hypothetical protein
MRKEKKCDFTSVKKKRKEWNIGTCWTFNPSWLEPIALNKYILNLPVCDYV